MQARLHTVFFSIHILIFIVVFSLSSCSSNTGNEPENIPLVESWEREFTAPDNPTISVIESTSFLNGSWNLQQRVKFSEFEPPVEIEYRYTGKYSPIEAFDEKQFTEKLIHLSEATLNQRLRINTEGLRGFEPFTSIWLDLSWSFKESRLFLGGGKIDVVATLDENTFHFNYAPLGYPNKIQAFNSEDFVDKVDSPFKLVVGSHNWPKGDLSKSEKVKQLALTNRIKWQSYDMHSYSFYLTFSYSDCSRARRYPRTEITVEDDVVISAYDAEKGLFIDLKELKWATIDGLLTRLQASANRNDLVISSAPSETDSFPMFDEQYGIPISFHYDQTIAECDGFYAQIDELQ
jgi:hypothetical protein